MSTYMPKTSEITRQWYIIDAAGKPLGRVAVLAAHILRGKHKPSFSPHADCGDQVIVLNAAKAVLTGRKAEQKIHYHHSGWIGGMKATSYKDIMKNTPEKAMLLAIKGMLPDNTVGRKSLTRVRVYRDENHKQQAQNPEVCPFEVK